MADLRKLDEITIPATPLVLEGSCGEIGIGQYESTMTLYWYDKSIRNGSGAIEWDIPKLHATVNIGIWVENGSLTDYDGISGCIPSAGVKLLRKHGIRIGRDFLPDKAS